MRYGFVTRNLVDLRSEPDHHSERADQLRFGETLSLGTKRKGFVRVTKIGGYHGWVDVRFIREISKLPTEKRGAERVVIVPTVTILDDYGHAVEPHFLYYGTKLCTVGKRGSRTLVSLPDGHRFSVATRALGDPEFRNGVPAAGQVLREVRRFLGVPYLWGGIASAGFDCSGLVQTVFGRFGIMLPRDTKDQIHAGVPVAYANIRPGDLLFFRRHVGIALGRERLIHASRGGGGVTVNSLRPDDDDFRKDLYDSFAMARRVL